MALQRNWSREELILAFNLYCRTPFGRIHNRNPEIIELANLINRTPSAVSWKLANFSRLDPAVQERGLSGATHGSRKEKEIWDEFHQNWDMLSFESEKLRAALHQKNIDEILDTEYFQMPEEGLDREAIVRVRINQNFFRATVLAAYRYKCCITGLNIASLLNASHIVPWSRDTKNRVNPRNGLCLNTLHDRAFDRGLLTISDDYTVIISSTAMDMSNIAVQDYLTRYDGKQITLPNKFMPDKELLKYHQTYIFQT